MITYFAVDSDGTEVCFNEKPVRKHDHLDIWYVPEDIYNDTNNVCLPKGTIKKLTGKQLTWEDEPIAIKDTLN